MELPTANRAGLEQRLPEFIKCQVVCQSAAGASTAQTKQLLEDWSVLPRASMATLVTAPSTALRGLCQPCDKALNWALHSRNKQAQGIKHRS